MRPTPKDRFLRPLLRGMALCSSVWLTACNSLPTLPSFGNKPEAARAPDPEALLAGQEPARAADLPTFGAARAPGFVPGTVPQPGRYTPQAGYSNAASPKDYRQDAARHLYAQNGHRIYQGRMPPMLYAVGVLDVEVNSQGQVTGTRWKRAPSHAPEVMAEIERTVQQAAPYPVPARLGRVVYTDVWLWHESGRFQLDTLTEGQD